MTRQSITYRELAAGRRTMPDGALAVVACDDRPDIDGDHQCSVYRVLAALSATELVLEDRGGSLLYAEVGQPRSMIDPYDDVTWVQVAGLTLVATIDTDRREDGETVRADLDRATSWPGHIHTHQLDRIPGVVR